MNAARLIAIIGVLAGGGALVLQMFLMLGNMSAEGFSPPAIVWRYLGYFTILTNIFVVLIWARAVLVPAREAPRLETAGVVSIAMTGIIYYLLLASRWHPQGLQWLANFTHHAFVPILFVLFWLARSRGALKWSDAPLFVIWPLAYCAYALTRGAFDGWYAYYFLDPTHVSIAQLVSSITVQSTGFLICALAFVGIDKIMSGRGAGAAQPAGA
jgi:hypothetical protein